MVGGLALHPLLRCLPCPPRRPPQRTQHVLPRLRRLGFLLLFILPHRSSLRSQRHPDTAVVVPRRGARGGDPKCIGHSRRPDLRHQQCAGALPQPASAAARRRARRCCRRLLFPLHMRDLRPRPPRSLPILLPRLQVGGDKGNRRRDLRAHPQRRRRRRGGGRRPPRGVIVECGST